MASMSWAADSQCGHRGRTITVAADVVISVGNCGLYVGPWGVRVEDTNVVGVDGPTTLTSYPRVLEAR